MLTYIVIARRNSTIPFTANYYKTSVQQRHVLIADLTVFGNTIVLNMQSCALKAVGSRFSQDISRGDFSSDIVFCSFALF